MTFPAPQAAPCRERIVLSEGMVAKAAWADATGFHPVHSREERE
jgi:hypothetical protein